jgi:hypothetical protein
MKGFFFGGVVAPCIEDYAQFLSFHLGFLSPKAIIDFKFLFFHFDLGSK